MKPFFSIIIPTLNEERYLPKLLQSLALQSYKGFEVIIVDANSEDKTLALALKYAKRLPRLRVINSSRRNVYLQRNIGAKYARGNFIVSLDADVLLPPLFLEGVHYAIVAKKLVFVTTWMEPDKNTSMSRMLIMASNLAIEMAKIVGKPFAGGFNTIIKKDIFEKIKGFRTDLSISEDHEFSTRVFKKGYELTILSEPRLILSLRRFRSQGTWQVLGIYMKASLYFLLNGPITDKKFGYQMGGHVHKKQKKKNGESIYQITKYFKQLDKLQKKINYLIAQSL